MADVDATLDQQVFLVPQRQGEADIHETTSRITSGKEVSHRRNSGLPVSRPLCDFAAQTIRLRSPAERPAIRNVSRGGRKAASPAEEIERG